MKLFLTLGLLLTVAYYSEALPRCHLSELWSCAEIAIDWLHTLPKRSLPETESDVEVMCTEINKALDCASGYRNNCTTPLQKELIGLIFEGTAFLLNDFCTRGSDTQTKYLTHSACLNKVSQMDEVKAQIEYILAIFEKAQSVQMSEAITFGCCGYSKVTSAFIKLGVDNCGQEAVDMVEELLSMAIAQLPDVICSGFNSEDEKCKAVLPPDGAKPSDNIKETEFYKFLRDVLRNWLD